MPLNLSESALSSLKIGESNVLKGIVGINQVYPNDADITAASFDNATIANSGGNTPYTVSGDIGASFTLQGSLGATPPSGTQVLASSPTTYQIPISSNTACDAASRNSAITILTQGNTVFNPVNLQTTDTITQAAGPVSQTTTGSTMVISVSNVVRNTITIGGQVLWAPGSAWNVSLNYTTGSLGASVAGNLTMRPDGASGPNWTFGGGTPNGFSQVTQYLCRFNPQNAPSTATYFVQVTLTNVNATSVQFNAFLDASGCVNGVPSSTQTAAFYP
jgi:hypothetical protein